MGKQQTRRFAERVRALRKARGMTQEQMAAVLAIHWTNYAKLERGERRVTLDEAATIAQMLGVALDDLVGEPEEAAKRQQTREALLVAMAEAGAVAKEHADLVLQRERLDLRIAALEPKVEDAYRRVKALEAQVRTEGEG